MVDFDYCRYVGKSNRTDRFFGMPCGCVMLARGFKMLPDNVIVPTEYRHTCCKQHVEEISKLALPFDFHLFDMFVSDTYSNRDEGTPWQ